MHPRNTETWCIKEPHAARADVSPGGRATRPFIGRAVGMCAGASVTRPCPFCWRRWGRRTARFSDSTRPARAPTWSEWASQRWPSLPDQYAPTAANSRYSHEPW